MDGVSQPSAREVPGGCCAELANSAIVCAENSCAPDGVTPFASMHLRKAQSIHRVGEKAGVTGDAAHYGSVFIVHFALDDTMPEAAVVLRGRNRGAHVPLRTETSRAHAERLRRSRADRRSRVARL